MSHMMWLMDAAVDEARLAVPSDRRQWAVLLYRNLRMASATQPAPHTEVLAKLGIMTPKACGAA